MCVVPFDDVTLVVMFFFVKTEVTIFVPVTGSGLVLGFSVQEVPVDFTVVACNVDALPTGGAEELSVRGV